jgi:4-amino-4-deoxy-L-arabinose transferase-like glycosyltransferase
MPFIGENNEKILLLACAVIYVVLRVIAWNHAIVLEDHDSTFYLKSINAYRSFDLQVINALSAYSTPFYPFISALLSLFGLSIESSARLASFIFSLLLFYAFYGIGKKVTGSTETLAGLFLLAVSPVLLPISYAILTEPSYIATIYTGLLVFLLQERASSLKWGALLGGIYGLAFLNRTEGILFVAVIPAVQAFYLLFLQGRPFPAREFTKWCGVYWLAFFILAAPQILHVSAKMDSFSLNGRTAWQLLENSNIGQSRVEKQSGLHFRKDETNISFARKNYNEAKRLLQELENQHHDTNYLSRAANNTRTIFRLIPRTHLGKIGSILAVIGVFALFLSGRKVETLLISGFAASTLAGPLLHADDIYGRHLLTATPALILFQAIGSVFLARKFADVIKFPRVNQDLLIVIIVFISMLYAVKPLYRAVLKPPVANVGYSIEEIKEPLKIIKAISKNELRRNPVIAAKKNYLAYYYEPDTYSGARTLYLPYTGYEGLVEYLERNNADFLYLRYSLISEFPFLEVFEQEKYSRQFRLLFTGVDARGVKTELYRFINSDLEAKEAGGMHQ